MQKGRYVFVARQDGSYRYCRNSDWLAFLTGQIPASRIVPVSVHSTIRSSSRALSQSAATNKLLSQKLIAYEVEIKTAVYSKQRISCVDSQGFYTRSELIELPSAELSELISADKDDAVQNHQSVLENYIDQLLYLDNVPVLDQSAQVKSTRPLDKAMQLELALPTKMHSSNKVSQTHLQCA